MSVFLTAWMLERTRLVLQKLLIKHSFTEGRESKLSLNPMQMKDLPGAVEECPCPASVALLCTTLSQLRLEPEEKREVLATPGLT